MKTARTYVNYMDDEKLLASIEKLYHTYERAFATKKLKDINKNIIDPFKFQFDTAFLHGNNPEDTLRNEIFRQNDKSIANAIGLFHQQLIGAIDGFTETPSLPCDVKKTDDTIFAEIKNKFNTMNVRSAAGVYDELAGLAKSYPKAMCYLVEIIAKKSTDTIWSITVNQTVQQNKRIHKISADQFYALATGQEDALKQLVDALPDAIRDFLKRTDLEGNLKNAGNRARAFGELSDQAGKYGIGVIDQIYRMAFPDYISFKK